MRTSVLLTIGLGLTLAACQDPSGPGGDRLSRAEALQLTAQMLATSEGAASTSAEASAGPTEGAAGPPTSFTQTHESTHPCPSGGELTVSFVLSGSFDEETNSLQADLSGSHTHAA
ncbi:MAG: hypothetical protein ACREK1_14205, partial [Longimicrobiales bacterium]